MHSKAFTVIFVLSLATASNACKKDASSNSKVREDSSSSGPLDGFNLAEKGRELELLRGFVATHHLSQSRIIDSTGTACLGSQSSNGDKNVVITTCASSDDRVLSIYRQKSSDQVVRFVRNVNGRDTCLTEHGNGAQVTFDACQSEADNIKSFISNGMKGRQTFLWDGNRTDYGFIKTSVYGIPEIGKPDDEVLCLDAQLVNHISDALDPLIYAPAPNVSKISATPCKDVHAPNHEPDNQRWKISVWGT